MKDAGGPTPARLAAGVLETAEALGLALDAGQADRLAAYIDLLSRWNATYNLTAVRDPRQMLTQHVADCLSAVSPLRRELAGVEAPRLLDVGSGAGLPGIVVAVVEPGWRVTLVDSVGKKAAFCRQAAAALGLAGVQSMHARVESLAPGPRFDVVVCRAFSRLDAFVSSTRQVLANDGRWMAMKGKMPTDELAQLAPEVDVFHVEPIQVPGLSAARHLVWIRLKQEASTNL